MPAIGHRGDQASWEWAGAARIHHLSKCITQVLVLHETDQQWSPSAQRWARCNKEIFFTTISVVFKGVFFVCAENKCRLAFTSRLGCLTVSCMVLLWVGRSTCWDLQPDDLGEWCRARDGSMKQLGCSGEAETTCSSWTNARGQAVFADSDFSLSLPGWGDIKACHPGVTASGFSVYKSLPRCWPRRDRSSVSSRPFEMASHCSCTCYFWK